MAYCIYKINNEKNIQTNKVVEQNEQISVLEYTVDNLQERINTISNIVNETENSKNNNSDNNKNSLIEESIEKVEQNVSNTQISIVGKYNNKSETSNYVHDASLVITNQTNSSIDFKLSAIHGSDIEHVNTGEVSGKATKIDIPQDLIDSDTKQYAYHFVENVDGTTCKITFVYTAYIMFEYVTVIEDYSDGINPYSGNRVYFEGNYEKIS